MLKDEISVDYGVETKNGNYNLTIIKKFNKPIEINNSTIINLKARSYTILLGGIQKGCVEINFLNPNVIPYEIRNRLNIDYGVATIQHINTGKECNIDGTLKKGDGTKHMVMTAMYIIYHTFDWINKFKLHDFSYADCLDGGKSAGFSVQRMSIALNGSTWYEHTFGAKLNESNYKKYKTSLKKLEEPNEKKSWEEFIVITKYRLNRNKELVETIYRNTKSYREFFTELKSKLSRLELCLTLQPWVGDLIDYTFGYEVETLDNWIIDGKTIGLKNEYRPKLQPYIKTKPNYLYKNYKEYISSQKGGSSDKIQYLKEIFGGFKFF